MFKKIFLLKLSTSSSFFKNISRSEHNEIGWIKIVFCKYKIFWYYKKTLASSLLSPFLSFLSGFKIFDCRCFTSMVNSLSSFFLYHLLTIFSLNKIRSVHFYDRFEILLLVDSLFFFQIMFFFSSFLYESWRFWIQFVWDLIRLEAYSKIVKAPVVRISITSIQP